MPRRELLTDEQRVQLFAFPPDRTELIRLATLSSTDLVFIRQHRQVMNRLGIAVQMIYLRSLGRAIGARERPYPPLLELLAEQLYMEPSSWNAYAVRAETRREHLLELFALLQMTAFEQIHQPEMVEYLLPVALQTTQGIALAQALIVELRKRRIALPTIAVLERICATASTRAQRSIHQMLIAPFSAEQRLQLDALLELRGDTPISALTWLRRPAGKPSAKSVLAHLERLKAIKELQIPAGLSRSVPQKRLGKLAREGMQTAVYQLAEYEKERRYATVIAILIDTNATLIDEILNLHDRILGSFFTRDKHQFAKKFSDEGKSVNEKVRLYAKVGALLIGAKEQGLDPFQEIERVLSWDRFIESVREAEKLSRDEEFDALTLLASHFTQLRRYSPIFLETFDFHAAPVASEILKGTGILREMNHTNARKVPTNAPMGFIRPRWQRFVQQGEEIDRRYYEFAVMSELKNALRGGDIWVPGSRQFKDFDEYLLPQEEFAKQHQDACLGLPVATTAKAYFEERLQCLHQELERTNALAASGELPDVELSEKGRLCRIKRAHIVGIRSVRLSSKIEA